MKKIFASIILMLFCLQVFAIDFTLVDQSTLTGDIKGKRGTYVYIVVDDGTLAIIHQDDVKDIDNADGMIWTAFMKKKDFLNIDTDKYTLYKGRRPGDRIDNPNAAKPVPKPVINTYTQTDFRQSVSYNDEMTDREFQQSMQKQTNARLEKIDRTLWTIFGIEIGIVIIAAIIASSNQKKVTTND